MSVAFSLNFRKFALGIEVAPAAVEQEIEVVDPAIGSASVEDDYAAMAVAIMGMKHAESTKKNYK